MASTLPSYGEKRIKHYSSKHKILLVGEGDFSFSLSLARAFGSATNMVATSLDSEGFLMGKYSNARENVKELKERGCTVIHDVDACTMLVHVHPSLRLACFDRIVFNFPHAGFSGLVTKESSLYQIERHQKLVKGFFSSARWMLTDFGEVHVTHKTSNPFSRWEIVKLGNEEGLELSEEAKFEKWDYPGYDNKRGDGFNCNGSFPVGACSTFIFRRR